MTWRLLSDTQAIRQSFINFVQTGMTRIPEGLKQYDGQWSAQRFPLLPFVFFWLAAPFWPVFCTESFWLHIEKFCPPQCIFEPWFTRWLDAFLESPLCIFHFIARNTDGTQKCCQTPSECPDSEAFLFLKLKSQKNKWNRELLPNTIRVSTVQTEIGCSLS